MEKSTGVVSVIIACYNEERYIENAVNSVITMDYPAELIEIIIIDGGSTDNSLKIIQDLRCKYNNIQLFTNPKRISPIAFNIGIKQSKGEYIMLMSAHSNYESTYFRILIKNIVKFNADLIGGFAETKTLKENKISNSIVKVFKNKFGLGGAKFRIGVDKAQKVDTVNGMFRKSIFDKVGLFNEKLVRNQDMELSKRILENGGSIYIIPDVSWTYYARDNFKDLWVNNFRNGKWVPLTIYITKNINSLSIRHVIPLMFSISIFLPLLLSLIDFRFIYITIISILVHFIFIFILAIMLNDKKTSISNIIKSFYVLHLSYGIGSLVGILSLPFQKTK